MVQMAFQRFAVGKQRFVGLGCAEVGKVFAGDRIFGFGKIVVPQNLNAPEILCNILQLFPKAPKVAF